MYFHIYDTDEVTGTNHVTNSTVLKNAIVDEKDMNYDDTS